MKIKFNKTTGELVITVNVAQKGTLSGSGKSNVLGSSAGLVEGQRGLFADLEDFGLKGHQLQLMVIRNLKTKAIKATAKDEDEKPARKSSNSAKDTAKKEEAPKRRGRPATKDKASAKPAKKDSPAKKAAGKVIDFKKAVAKRGRGRPAGSKNKAKAS
jgi:hypothetical protein